MSLNKTATLTTTSPPLSPSLSRRKKSCARRFERRCCTVASYFPLAFVYGLTTWAVWIQALIGFSPIEGTCIGRTTTLLGIVLYALLNWSYTTAVFTSPGSPLDTEHTYSTLSSQDSSSHTSLTVKSTGDARFCKKCQSRKPDRAHHCSTCRRCVLKMDHHCPWLATCVGFRNYKPFLLFLIYTCLFCWLCFAVSASWIWTQVLSDNRFQQQMMPVNYILLAVMAGILGVVLTGFTLWHVHLACKGQTTIESLETTRYLTPLRKQLQQRNPVGEDGPGLGDQLREIHANVLPGVTRQEEGLERTSPAHHSLRQNYSDMEETRERERYDDYLDEQDSEKLPNAFDLGWRRNLTHVLGEKPWLWVLPICNSTGDGWRWEASPKWLEASQQLAKEREARARENEVFARERRGWQHGPIVDFRGLPPRFTRDPWLSEHPEQGQTQHSQMQQTDLYDSSDEDVREKDERRPLARPQNSTVNWNDIPDDVLGMPRRGRIASGMRPRSRGSPGEHRMGKDG